MQKTYSSGCSGSTLTRSPCDGGVECFHHDTEITLNGKLLDLAAVRKGEHLDCVIPHTIAGQGVMIKTACNAESLLRLTGDHLVFTSKGLVAASRVQAGDDLYLDMDQKLACKVIDVKDEPLPQQYFGLNCASQSVVLANGYKTSTFGTLHTLPSLWMRHASQLLGVQRASRIGDSFASILRFFGLL